MARRLWCIPLLSLFVFTLSLHAQEYSYTQYNIKEGLAANTVYCATQDKEGFMWFGTETGLSRFDGSKFKNFTTADGLIDNEILRMFCDSKGRLWLSLYKKDICYYYKGKIYTRYNDSNLSRLHLTDLAWQICEDAHGNILIMEQGQLHKIAASGKITVIKKINDNRPLQLCNAISKSMAGNFLVLDKDSLYELNQDDHFSFVCALQGLATGVNAVKLSSKYLVWLLPDVKVASVKVTSLVNQQVMSYPSEFTNLSFDIIRDSLICRNTINGILLYDLNNPKQKVDLLPGKSISSVCMDNENNLWCTTLGTGIFRINSLDFRNIFFYRKNGERIGVYSIYSLRNHLFAGADRNYIYSWQRENPLQRSSLLIGKMEMRNKVTAIESLKNKTIITGRDLGINKLPEGPRPKNWPADWINVKRFFKINDDSFLVANFKSLLLFNPETLTITDTLWRERNTAVFYQTDTFYAGTLDGLLVLDRYRHASFPGDKIPLLKNTITAMTGTNDGTIWMATYGGGVIAYKHGNVITNITEKDGLTSNICRCLYADGNILWAGTNKGLNKIDLSAYPYRITKITSADALASDIINTVYVDHGVVYVGTPEGITYFDAKNIVSYSRCDLRITQIIAGNDTLNTDADNLTLSHENNDIAFEFSGISFKSAGDITFYYKLTGLDTTWQTTRNNFINYTTLPSGSYTFQLKAVNKFGIESDTTNIKFEVAQLLWEKTWFRLLIVVAVLILAWIIVRMRIRYIQKRSNEKLITLQRMNELEQLALKSQMNPHFIFNSLNSIQQYVMDKDVEGANRFITGFSKLIRSTLEFSDMHRISIAEEMEYLSTYLDLECERLTLKFTYQILYDSNVNRYDLFIPPMILQPYLENAVRHGIRYRKDNNGKILINVKKQNNTLVITVEDNGIGRKEAAKYKSENIIQYQSKGMNLTAKRIEMMNKKAEGNMQVFIEDLEEKGTAKGTRVTVIFPLQEDDGKMF